MRRIAISVFTVFVVFPALADARLPVVNLSAGGISARAAFGEPIVAPVKPKNASSGTMMSDAGAKRSDVAKPVAYGDGDTIANRVATAPVSRASVDHGEQIVASADVLVPNRPSSDLWARAGNITADVPLRLPEPSEFSVIRSDAKLPEESLFDAPRTTTATPRAATVANNDVKSMSELDEQIARMNDARRRADTARANIDASPRASDTRRVVARSVVARPSAPVAAAPELKNIARNDTDVDASSGINLSRMVVPMDDDVVVRAVQRSESPRIASVRDDMTSMSPSELRRAFRKTFLSENKHLSTFQIDDRFDVASDMTANAAGFTSARDLSETGNIRTLEIKINFRNGDSALSRANYETLASYASVVLQNPTRAVQVSIPQSATKNADDRKLAARRLAIVEQVLRDNGITEQRILPVLSQRDQEGLVLRMISLDQYETLTRQQRDIFGDTVNKKTYRSMSW